MGDFGDMTGEPWYMMPLFLISLLLFAVIAAPIIWIGSLFGAED
jgi:hypothetical protein